MNDAVLICAQLLRHGTVARAELRALDLPDVRHEVERRLEDVGLVLATSAYSEHVGIRLSADVAADAAFDAASNLGLRADACALLVILWARLVLQKRTAADTREVPGQASLLPHDQAAAARDFTPHVRLETLYREFGETLGSRTHIKGLVSQLRRLGFLVGHGDIVEAGPLLELGIDGERMIAFIRRKVLAELLARGATSGAAEGSSDGGVEGQVLEVLARLGGGAAMKDLVRETGERPERLRELLRGLMAVGRVERRGERVHARYHLTSASQPGAEPATGSPPRS
jgi:hypothetical protein